MVNPGGSAQPPPVGAGSLSWKRCAGCGGKIADRFLLYAMDSYWHSRCLKCSCCQAQLGEIGTSCYTKSGMILCRNDYIRLDTFIIEVTITTSFMCSKTVSALWSFCVHKGHSLKFLQISDALVKLILNGVVSNVFWSFEDSLVLLGCFFVVFEAKLQIVHTSGHYDSPATTWNDIRHVMIRWSDGCQEKKDIKEKVTSHQASHGAERIFHWEHVSQIVPSAALVKARWLNPQRDTLKKEVKPLTCWQSRRRRRFFLQNICKSVALAIFHP